MSEANIRVQIERAFAEVESIWRSEFDRLGLPFRPAKLNIVAPGATEKIGNAVVRIQMEYSPIDYTINFPWDEATDPIEQFVWVAHEYAHHIQNLTGILTVRNSFKPRDFEGCIINHSTALIELHADALSGWAYSKRKGQLNDFDLLRALDSMQRGGSELINPKLKFEKYTHGRSTDRGDAFVMGLNSSGPDFRAINPYTNSKFLEIYQNYSPDLAVESSSILNGTAVPDRWPVSQWEDVISSIRQNKEKANLRLNFAPQLPAEYWPKLIAAMKLHDLKDGTLAYDLLRRQQVWPAELWQYLFETWDPNRIGPQLDYIDLFATQTQWPEWVWQKMISSYVGIALDPYANPSFIEDSLKQLNLREEWPEEFWEAYPQLLQSISDLNKIMMTRGAIRALGQQKQWTPGVWSRLLKLLASDDRDQFKMKPLILIEFSHQKKWPMSAWIKVSRLAASSADAELKAAAREVLKGRLKSR